MYGVCIMYVLRDHQRNTVKAVCLFFWVRLKGYRSCEPGTVDNPENVCHGSTDKGSVHRQHLLCHSGGSHSLGLTSLL